MRQNASICLKQLKDKSPNSIQVIISIQVNFLKADTSQDEPFHEKTDIVGSA